VTGATPPGVGSLVAVGVSHQTATIDLRERVALDEPAAGALLADLRAIPGVSAAVVLSTCNRTELYALTAAPTAVDALRGGLAGRSGQSPAGLAAAGYAHRGEDAIAHLFRVAAGLDSAVVGEPEIQHQVRRAAALAAAHELLGDELGAVFRHALACGRRVRRETGIGRGATSTASVCVALAGRALGGLPGRRALVLGAGTMASSAARALARRGVAELVVLNRNPTNARRLARSVGGRSAAPSQLVAELARADLAVACTGASLPVVRRADAARALRRRHIAPLVCIDLALPRDVEPAVGSLDGVVLLDIDDVRRAADASRSDRALEARRAEAIVAADVVRFAHRARHPALATVA
jgi:glutamyl-tRNA reductase